MTETFLTWGDMAGTLLHSLNKHRGESHPVIAMLDDFRIGSLDDADTAYPEHRMTLWKEIWRAQWWYDDRFEATLTQRLRDSQRALRHALKERHPLVVWIGNNAHDHLMLAMVAAQLPRDVPLLTAGICDSARFRDSKISAVSMCSLNALMPLIPVEISDEQRDMLSLAWQAWKIAATGWRVMSKDGYIRDIPFDQLDNTLLERLSLTEPQSVDQLVTAMQDILPERILLWRLNILCREGRVIFQTERNLTNSVFSVMLA